MSQKEMPWMVDGKPGQIQELIGKCIADAPSVVKDKDGTSAQDVIDVARTVFVRHGINYRVMASDLNYEARGQGMYASMSVTLHFQAPDGSYWPCSTPTGALAPNLKSAQAALTAGIKSLLRHVLMLHVVADESQARDTGISEGLRRWHDTLLTFRTVAQLHENTDHPARLALTNEELPTARVMYREREEELFKAASQDKVIEWQARQMQNDQRNDAKVRK